MARGAQRAKKLKAPGGRPTSAATIAALEQRLAATSDILRIVSRSRTDVQPVFDAILASAVRLLGAHSGGLTQIAGNQIILAALTSTDPAGDAVQRANYPQPIDSDDTHAQAIRSRAPINFADAQADARLPATLHVAARARGFHSLVAVPLLRQDEPLGAITVTRREPGGFTDDEIGLLETFADHAVIAIENARLLNELQDKNVALTQAHAQVSEALEQQTATSEILKVIASSPTDAQPVFDAIAGNAARLCSVEDVFIVLVDGEALRAVAGAGRLTGLIPDYNARRIPVSRTSVAGRVIVDRTTLHIDDLAVAPEDEFPDGRALQRMFNHRTMLATPLLRDGAALGAIVLFRLAVRPFAERQIELLKTFADQAVIAIENVRLFTELQTSNRELTTALDTQTATSDILRVISRSQTEVQPVFDAIVASAVRLLGAYSGGLTQIAGDEIVLAAFTSTDPSGDAILKANYPQPIDSGLPPGQSILSRAPINIADAQADAPLPEGLHIAARARGFHSLVAVPLLRQDEPLGAISVTRREPGGFTDDEIALLQTFADQAVIAIENVRLFTELQHKNEALTRAHAQVSEALEQQTATAEILRVISSSPTDLTPVLNIVVQSAARFCGSDDASLFQLDGDTLRQDANYGPVGDIAGFRIPVVRGTVGGRTVLERRAVHVADAPAEVDEYPEASAISARVGHRTILSVPLLREETPIGVLQLRRAEVKPFTDKQIELLKTFADQAVIAIENVRLFTELQTSNRELTSALDTQTATADILRVISRSQSDVQPVFDAIVASAARLLGAYSGALTRIAGEQIELAAITSTSDVGDASLRAAFPQPLSSAGPHGRTIRDRAPLNIADAHTDPRLPEAVHVHARVRGYQSQIVVPMLRHDEAIGTISLTRGEPGGFTVDEIGLLQTFADQAVIAIENSRLLNELQARTQDLTRSVDELRALSEIGQAIGSTLDLQTVLSAIVARARQLAGADAGVIYEYDTQSEVFEPRATERLEAEIMQALVATPVRKGQGATGQLAEVLEPIQMADVRVIGAQMPLRELLIGAGYRALLAVPLAREGHLIGALTVFRKTPGEYAANVVELLQTFATQSALAIQNARLFREIERKSRELEVASQHKSEFLASMSHELRTPLNAVIGFSDVLLEGMFGETNEKQTEYLRDILSSGQHLLSLINDILDLSKIEAGRMELDVTTFDLPAAIDDAILLMRERAGRRGVALTRHVDTRLGAIRADQRKVKQVLLNLLSNAVKFTPAGGRIDVRAGLDDGATEISVTDTGIGIAPEDQDAVFEEFRQVGTADRKAEGTGLGLALCRKFVELHGGRIWVKSQQSIGSTFTFTIPSSTPPGP